MNLIESIIACPGCKFDPTSTATMAANMAIGFMILILFVVLSGFIALIWRLARGERLAQMADQEAQNK